MHQLTQILLVAVIFAFAGLSIGRAEPLQPEELEHASQILNAKNDTVKRWEYVPEIALLHDQDYDVEGVRKVLREISTATGLLVTLPPQNIVDIRQLPQPIFGNAKVRYNHVDKSTERYNVTMDLRAAGRERVAADLWVFVVSVEVASYIEALRQVSSTLTRQFAEGVVECYYHSHSNDFSLQSSAIFIRSDIDMGHLRNCEYEELFQSMGLVNDAEGTPYFTFDNRKGHKARDLDYLLLQALYAEHLKNGSPVASVVQEYQRLRSND